jgi:hypothetical protein
MKVHVRLENTGNSAAIETTLTLLGSDGTTRILPAYYGDNYISLLPGETKEIEIESPSGAAATNPTLGVRGWNVAERMIKVNSEN